MTRTIICRPDHLPNGTRRDLPPERKLLVDCHCPANGQSTGRPALIRQLPERLAKFGWDVSTRPVRPYTQISDPAGMARRNQSGFGGMRRFSCPQPRITARGQAQRATAFDQTGFR